jgi:benzoate membrane transport protein
MRASVIINALVAVVVGFGSTLAIIVAAAQALGATTSQISSSVSAICLALAISTTYLSIRHRIPMVTAWSTPGAALIAATDGSISFTEGVGAYIAVAAAILLTAFLKPLTRLVERIPASIAAGMLAGVLIKFVIAVFDQAAAAPLLVLPLFALFLVVRSFSPAWAVISVLIAGTGLVYGLDMAGPLPKDIGLTTYEFIMPIFDPAALIGLAVPLYLVTMASQNLPGFAVLRGSGYTPPTASALTVTGLTSLGSAFFGALTTNMAAITAAICTGPDTHPDASKRWMTGPFYGFFYLILSLFGASLVALFAALPTAFIATIAGLALLSPLVGAATTALKDEAGRVAAMATLCVTASSLSLFGIGSAFWGVLAGLAVIGMDAFAKKIRRRRGN